MVRLEGFGSGCRAVCGLGWVTVWLDQVKGWQVSGQVSMVGWLNFGGLLQVAGRIRSVQEVAGWVRCSAMEGR